MPLDANITSKILAKDPKARTEAKEVRKRIIMTCSSLLCNAVDSIEKPTFKRCSRCLGPMYCSRPCQKEDWKDHKLVCVPAVPETLARQKILLSVANAPTLLPFYNILSVLWFSIHERTPEELAQRIAFPFHLDVLLHAEPVHAYDFIDLYNGQDIPSSTPLKGMPQIVEVRCPDAYPGQRLASPTQTPKTAASFKKYAFGSEQKLCRVHMHFHKTVGGHNGTTMSRWTQRLDICLPDLEWAMKQPPIEIPVVLDGVFTKVLVPLTVDTYIEYINGVIRCDVANNWLLRADLPQLERTIISLARDPPPGHRLAEALNRKIRQERVYALADEKRCQEALLKTST